ncbi:hypothetical protein ACLOJK_004958 [Asimina triloba]
MAAMCHAQEDDMFSKNLQKRYDGLMTVRTRAIKGKGAWYWSHLEPILFQNQDTGTAKAIKLRCGLCNALFSASNPSRTATEHLKRGTCPYFNNGVPKADTNSNGSMPKFRNYNQMPFPALLQPLAVIAPPSSTVVPMLPGPTDTHLSEVQIKTAFDLLADWFYESCGSVSFSCLDHPKFKAFLQHLGLPTLNKSYICGKMLESKYAEARFEMENKLRDTMFFQLSTNGWKKRKERQNSESIDTFVNVMLNLPNGSSLFHKALIFRARNAPADYIKEVLWSTVEESSGGDVFRCAGIITDADAGNTNSSAALRELEHHHHWMVNITCQSNALRKLLEDFFENLPLFTSIASICHKITHFLNSRQQSATEVYINQCLDFVTHPTAAIDAVENVAQLSHTLRQTITGDTLSGNPPSPEISDAVQDLKFWEDLEAVVSLTKLLKAIVQDTEEERPCLGQCLPLWEEVKSRIKRWCSNFSVKEEPVMELVSKRFSKNYHQAWSASFVLDPLYLVEDSSGKYLPPFKRLTSEQEKDAVKLITRLAHKEEAPIALMELMKWRMEGLDPIYARAVQAKERDPITGKMRVVNPRGSRLVWETYLGEFKVLRKVAVRLIFLQATASGPGLNRPFLDSICSNGRSKDSIDKVQKLMFVSSFGRLERKELVDDDKDSDLSVHEDYATWCEM